MRPEHPIDGSRCPPGASPSECRISPLEVGADDLPSPRCELADEAGPLEDGDVLLDRREAHRVVGGQLGHALLPVDRAAYGPGGRRCRAEARREVERPHPPRAGLPYRLRGVPASVGDRPDPPLITAATVKGLPIPTSSSRWTRSRSLPTDRRLSQGQRERHGRRLPGGSREPPSCLSGGRIADVMNSSHVCVARAARPAGRRGRRLHPPPPGARGIARP